MITTYGKRAIISVLAGRELSLGSALSLGVGTTTPGANDTVLESEVLRAPVTLRSPDYITDQVIYRATLPAEVSGKFYEVGLCNNTRSVSNQFLFGDTGEVWTNGVLDSTNARVGQSAVRIDATSSGNKTATIDKSVSIPTGSLINLNYFVGSNVSSAYVRLRTDASNYYHYALPVTAGYRVVTVPLTSFTPTGAPSSENITSVVVYLASTSGGASQLHLDSISVHTPQNGGDLIVRQVLAQPIVKVLGVEQDIEVPLTITI